VQSDRYGGFDENGFFMTATIPPSYQKWPHLPGPWPSDNCRH